MSMSSQQNTGGQRAFAQKLPRQHATEVRRALSAASESSRPASCSSSSLGGGSSLCGGSVLSDITTLYDYEDTMNEQEFVVEGVGGPADPLRGRLSFPTDDLQIYLLPRPCRTQTPVVPPEPMESLNSHVRDCVRCYTAPWLVVQRRYREFGTGSLARPAAGRLGSLTAAPRQEFEVDVEAPDPPTVTDDADSGHAMQESTSKLSENTPRGSWASFDLRQTASDPLLPGLLDRLAPETIDSVNRLRRTELQLDTLFAFYPPQEEEDLIERRCQPDAPVEHLGHRILVKCTQLLLELEIEPIYACMALYDLKEKKKISENFYFDLNSDAIKHMMDTWVPYQDVSTLSRSCIFSTTYPSADLFLVVKLEKVLQGDIGECTEPYIKDDKNRDKVRANAVACCERLGRYRMPFAWTGIHLHTILHGANSLERERDPKSGAETASTASATGASSSSSSILAADGAAFPAPSGANSLDRKSSASSFDQFRRKAELAGTASAASGVGTGNSSSAASTVSGGSWSRRGSLERRSAYGEAKRTSWASAAASSSSSTGGGGGGGGADGSELGPDAIGASLDTFRPVTLTVSSFFKQEGERLRDDDLFKYLHELKRSSSSLKRLKCLPGTLKLEVSPCPDDVKYALTPELARLQPYPDDKMRPTKELVEFAPREVYSPFYTYRNLLYVYPKNINFTNRPGSARNIAVRVQFMCGEQEQHAMPVIYGKSSCPEFSSDYFTAVTYHNKFPDFYDEIKIKLPANMKDCHHLLFTFYHVSCQKKIEQAAPVETIVGYTWLPMMKDGSLQTGEFSLPVMLDPPPANYLYISPEVMLPGTRWVDNHKGIFNVVVEASTSVHTLDRHLDRFLNICSALEENRIVPHIGESNMESSLKTSITELTIAKTEPMVKFLPLVLDKLIGLIVEPPLLNGQVLNCAHTTFEALATIVKTLTEILEHLNDAHGRNSLLATYVHYQACIPPEQHAAVGVPVRPLSMPPQRKLGRRSSQSDVATSPTNATCDAEVQFQYQQQYQQQQQLHQLQNQHLHHQRKLLHEEVALLWAMANNSARDAVFSNAWFFFELMVKSMVEQLASQQKLESSRKQRFADRFLEDVSRLVTLVTTEILHQNREESAKGKGDSRPASVLNVQLAFFLHDLLSVMDRSFVFSLVRTYCRLIAEDRAAHPQDVASVTSLKLDFLRVLCSHEHLVALSLPHTSAVPSGSTASSPSPSPSLSSSNSQTSLVSTLVGSAPPPSSSPLPPHTSFQDGTAHHGELSPTYRQQHFLISLALAELASAAFELPSPALHARAANLVRNLITAHDWDPRYNSNTTDLSCKARVAALYLPLIGILLDGLPHLYDWNSEAKGRPMAPDSGPLHALSTTTSTSVDPAVAQAIAGIAGAKGVRVNADTTRHLLMCLLWVLRHVDQQSLKTWWSRLAPQRLHRLLELLFICASCFEYRGRRHIRRCLQQRLGIGFGVGGVGGVGLGLSVGGGGGGLGLGGVKSRLEEMILGQGSARSEMMQRRRERNPSPSSSGYSSLGDRRWRRDVGLWRSASEVSGDKPMRHVDIDLEAHVEGNLSSQTSLIILDTLETIIQVVSQHDNLQVLLPVALRVLLHLLGCCQSTSLLQSAFATQRALVFKFPGLLFDEETELCADLCLRLLRHCSSNIGSIRSQASASLYLLMRQNFEIGNNFARVKMQVTMSLSSLVGTSQTFSEEALRRSLKTILVYAEQDVELQDTTFPEQVQDLVFNLHMILSDTVKMKEFQEDPEMLLDLMYRIAKGYQNSPDLRLTWLATMAQKHTERNNHAEAAMCLIHSAALVSEYLCMLEDRRHLPTGAVPFERLTANAVEESAVSDDVLCPDEEGFCTGKYFTEGGLIGLLEQAANSFKIAGMYESTNEVYKILTPIAEAQRDYKKLANIHGKLHDAFTRIDQQQGKRVFGTYFRVGFYGPKFGDLDGEEFIYKEPTLTKLPEISHRLESFYSERFGASNVVMIKDSNPVDVGKLNPERAYIQITYVEPYFDVAELRQRVTVFERNYNIKRFMYATPFTPDGRAHGELHEQYKRKTILTTANHFPYVKTRIQVVDRRQMVLTPIEVAIEDIQKKLTELAAATHQEPADPKILQMVLQGCIGTTVNQGPMEVAHVFLGDLGDQHKVPDRSQLKLRLCFKDFSKKCSDALRRNKSLIGPDQFDYQKELERNYRRFTERLAPIISLESTGDNSNATTFPNTNNAFNHRNSKRHSRR